MRRDQDWDRFRRVIAALGEAFERKLTPTLAELYWAALERFTIEEVEFAGRRAIELKVFFPKPVELISLIEGEPGDRAAIAFDQVERAVSSVGTHRDVVFDDPVIHRVITSMGGWEAYGCLPDGEKDRTWRRKEFERLYQTHSRTDGEPVLVLSGSMAGQTITSAPAWIGEPERIVAWRRALGIEQAAPEAEMLRAIVPAKEAAQ